jgi:YgiT-type zinc finger domain-containing protein
MTSDASPPSPPQTSDPSQAPCPRCSAAAAVTTVRTAIWRDDVVVIVEDIPALACGACQEQFYSEDVSDALRALMEDGFPAEAVTRRIEVPVFSLQNRVRTRVALPDDTLID